MSKLYFWKNSAFLSRTFLSDPKLLSGIVICGGFPCLRRSRLRWSPSRAIGHGTLTAVWTHKYKREIIPKQHNNDCEPSILYVYMTISPPNHCFVSNIKYIMPQCSDVTSMFPHSAVCWWVTAPHVPNVKTSLFCTLQNEFGCYYQQLHYQWRQVSQHLWEPYMHKR